MSLSIFGPSKCNYYILTANGKAVDATQELIAIGIANIANSFVQGFPGTGSLSRSAVNNARYEKFSN